MGVENFDDGLTRVADKTFTLSDKEFAEFIDREIERIDKNILELQSYVFWLRSQKRLGKIKQIIKEGSRLTSEDKNG